MVQQFEVPEVKEKVDIEKLNKDQQNDDVIGMVYESVKNKVKPGVKLLKTMSRQTRQLFRYFGNLKINENGTLVKQVRNHHQIVLPKEYHYLVYKHLHEQLGHLGVDRVMELARKRFYWSGMYKDIEKYVKCVCKCLKDKKPNIQHREELGRIESTQPFEVICIDFLHLDKCKGGFEYLLVVVDNFSRFAQAYPTKTKKAKAAADRIFNEFILNYGFPTRIHHDRGAEFNNKMWDALHKLTGIRKSNTTPYHPMGNGQCERLNRTILNMLKTLSQEEKANWKDHVKKLTFAYNSTVCRATGFSPHYLMFGRESRLPIDFMFEQPVEPVSGSKEEFVSKWQKSLQQACDIAKRNADLAAGKSKDIHDRKAKGVGFQVGDRVLVKNLSDRGGTGKLRSYWEDKIHVVVECFPGIPVFKVQREDGSGRIWKAKEN